MNESVKTGSLALFSPLVILLVTLLSMILLLMPFARLHADDVFGNETDIFPNAPDIKIWQEQDVILPAYPDEENLLPVSIVSKQFKCFLDATSISVGSDGVVRYSVVLVSKSGVRNVFYEGIRCDVKEYRTYAYGSGAGPFREMASGWKPISSLGSQRYRSDLGQGYFCKGGAVPEKVKNIVRELSDTF